MIEFLVAYLILFCAYLVRGIAGFGSGLIAIPLLSLIYPVKFVVPAVVLLDYLGSALQGVHNREHISWANLLPLLPFTLTGILLALYVFKNTDQRSLDFMLGCFVIAFAGYQLLPLPPLHASRFVAAPFGLIGGLVGTLFGTGGPFYVMYLTMRDLNKTSLRASFASYFLIDGTVRLMGYVSVGLLNVAVFIKIAQLLPPAALGLYLGGKVHTDISQKTFKYFISFLLLVSGTALLLK